MLSEGIITEQQLKDAFDLQAQTKVMLGRILVKKGLVSEPKVSEILRLKAEETIYSLFLWADSDFVFLENELPPGDQVLISIRVEDVLMEGLRRYDTSKKIRQLLPHNGVILEKARRATGKNPEMNALIQVAEEHFIDKAYRHYLPPKKIPVLKKPLESLVNQDLSPEEGFLVSRVNGSWDLRSIITISPLREVDALRAFKKLRERGIIDLVEAQAKTA